MFGTADQLARRVTGAAGATRDAMHSTATASRAALLSAADAVAGLTAARERTLALVADVSDHDMERVHSTLMSPLVWDLGHIAAFEDLWLAHRQAGQPLLRAGLAELYDAFETPRAQRGALDYLRHRDAIEYLAGVRERVLDVVDREGVGDGRLYELVIRHEQQHAETMLQTLCLARLEDYSPPGIRPAPAAEARHTGLELVEIPAGNFVLGAEHDAFAYDNERPAHVVGLPAFRIGRAPVTNGAWLEFCRERGYERRELWSEQGWHWLARHDVRHPGGWLVDSDASAPGERCEVREWRLGGVESLDPHKPVIHISWFEADAFARAHGLRVPTEAEWEKAASWDPERAAKRDPRRGDDPRGAAPGNLAEAGLFGTAPVDAYPDGASAYGLLATLGDVWEWTASDFGGYPGFVADPYPEYSEVFFGPDYKVLRGGSWASSSRVIAPEFRNWDYPQRRQIFAGVRLAGDV